MKYQKYRKFCPLHDEELAINFEDSYENRTGFKEKFICNKCSTFDNIAYLEFVNINNTNYEEKFFVKTAKISKLINIKYQSNKIEIEYSDYDNLTQNTKNTKSMIRKYPAKSMKLVDLKELLKYFVNKIFSDDKNLDLVYRFNNCKWIKFNKYKFLFSW